MINKIKDFLKIKLSKKASNDFSNQAESLDGEDKTNPGFIMPTEKQNVAGDGTGDYHVSFKDKMALSFVKLKHKFYGSRILTTKLPKISSGSHRNPLISPSLSRSIEKILSRESREPIHQLGLVLIICSITYTLGKVTALGLRGTPSLDSAKDFSVSIPLNDDFNAGALAQVKSINIFRTNTGLGKKKNNLADKKCDKPDQRSDLPIKLINTIVLQDTVKSLASVQVRGARELEEVRIGDQISNIAKIAKISRLEILVKNLESGMCESISSDKLQQRGNPIAVMSPSQSREFKLNKKISGIENDGNKFIISKALLDEKIKDLAAILTQARAIKIQNPDGSLAFKMTELDPQGLFPYLGIQDQDIITSINGKPIYDMNEIMTLFGRIKGLEKLSLGIKREGSDSVQDYSIKK